MNMLLDDISLSLINRLNSIVSIKDELLGIEATEITDQTDVVEKKLKDMEAGISLAIMETSQLVKLYQDSFNLLIDIRNALRVKINDRKNSNVQMNTNGTLYNDEIMLKDIYLSYDIRDEITIDDIHVDEIVDASEYSYLKIVSHMERENSLLNDIKDLSKSVLMDTLSVLNLYNQKLLQLKDKLNTPDILSEMVNDPNILYNLIGEIETLSLVNARCNCIKLFQLYLDIKHNYDIYKVAVERYTSFALECFFNNESVYEIC